MRTPVADRLAAATLALVDIASPSRDERAVADHVLACLTRAGLGDACVRRRDSVATLGAHDPGSAERVLLVGHLDTVPPQDNLPGVIDGDLVRGLGSADMKGALAVMLALAEDVASGDVVPKVALDFVFYDREEVAVAESGLTPLLDEFAPLRSAALAIVMEPTGGAVQLGCLGNIDASAVFEGQAGHSARPWLADNAVHKGIRALRTIAELEPTDDVIDGLTFREVAGVTLAEGGHAANVVPDRFEVRINLRYSPRRTPEDAEALLAELVPGADVITVRSNSPGALPCAGSPLVERLISAGDLDLEPKQAWTDVAQFATAGVPALNFGPGDPALAHARDEAVAIADLVAAYETLVRFLTAGDPPR